MEEALPHLLIVSTLFLGMFAVFAAWQSVAALRSHRRAPVALEATTMARQSLEHEKESLLLNLRDLAQDRDLGKLSEADYQPQQRILRERAREVLRLLDEDLGPYLPRADALIAARASLAADRACPSCATTNDPDARFCKECAHALLAGEEAR